MTEEEYHKQLIGVDLNTLLKDPNNWVQVESSNVKEVLYSPLPREMCGKLARGNIYVRFNSGGVYVYCSILAEAYENMLKAESIGKYINQNLRGNCLTFKIDI